MPIATFAGKVFQVDFSKTHTFYELEYSSELQTEKQDAEGKKPSTYIKGSGLDSITFKVKLDRSLGVDPRVEWESWLTILNAGVAYPFILGTKPLGNHNWLLVNVSPSNFVIDNLGNIRSLELSLQFDEYVRAGTKKEKTKKTTAPGISKQVYAALEKQIIDSEEKAQQKRQNPKMVRAGYEPR